MKKREFKIEIVREGAIGTMILGASKLPVKKMEEVMNRYGAEGWEMNFMVLEQHRMLLFWAREAAVITFSREIA
ncbi:DUF4177 domain-containing protein [Desulfococcus sp.]|uniref:DUF4177 domain-containing protein n=1 Tax=Desulfococcus sp. TaxID=2025834 RepID=UPI003593CD02